LFKSYGIKKINELIVTSNKSTDNFAGLLTSGLKPDVTRGPPVGSLWHKIMEVAFLGIQTILNAMLQTGEQKFL
jgi:hypothetical protein